MARQPMYTPEQKKIKQAEWVANWRKNNPEKQLLARKRAYDNRKRKAMELVGGAVCVTCGCDNLDALEFNHINGGGSSEHREYKNRPIMDRLLTLKREVKDINIMCRVCNALDHLERKSPGIIKHYSVRYHKFVTGDIEGWEDGTPVIGVQ